MSAIGLGIAGAVHLIDKRSEFFRVFFGGLYYFGNFLNRPSRHSGEGAYFVAGFSGVGSRPSGKFPGGCLLTNLWLHRPPDGVYLAGGEVLADGVFGNTKVRVMPRYRPQGALKRPNSA